MLRGKQFLLKDIVVTIRKLSDVVDPVESPISRGAKFTLWNLNKFHRVEMPSLPAGAGHVRVLAVVFMVLYYLVNYYFYVIVIR